MIVDNLKSFFKRDLQKLSKEIEFYKVESNLWLIDKEIANSAGNLCFHLIGNLNHFIGSVLGNSGYIRQRAYEFSATNISRAVLLEEIDKVSSVIENTLAQLSDQDLEDTYPLIVFEKEMTTGYFLIHLLTHFNYHLGQINYHRRLLDA